MVVEGSACSYDYLVAIAIATRTLLLIIKTLEGTRSSLGSKKRMMAAKLVRCRFAHSSRGFTGRCVDMRTEI